MAGFTPGQAFLGALLNSKDQKGVSFGDNMLMAHHNPTLDDLDAARQAQFEKHGALGVGWGEPVNPPGTVQEIPVIPYQEQEKYNPFKNQTVTLPDGRVVERTPENSSPYGF
jgi:hypothetical protein